MTVREEGWGVIFDVDGTMVSNAAYHEQAWIEFGRKHGLPITSQYYRRNIHARGNDDILRTLYGDTITPEQIAHAMEEKETLYRAMYRPVMQPNPGLHLLLYELHEKGIPCSAASNSPVGNVDMVLDGLHIRSYFKAVYAQGPEWPGKPNPAMLLAAADAMQLPAHRCIVLEDSPSGFQAAENAGMRYIVIECGAEKEGLKHATCAVASHRDFTSLDADTLHRYCLSTSCSTRSIA